MRRLVVDCGDRAALGRGAAVRRFLEALLKYKPEGDAEVPPKFKDGLFGELNRAAQPPITQALTGDRLDSTAFHLIIYAFPPLVQAALASVAAISTSSQLWNFACSLQTAPISGRV